MKILCSNGKFAAQRMRTCEHNLRRLRYETFNIGDCSDLSFATKSKHGRVLCILLKSDYVSFQQRDE